MGFTPYSFDRRPFLQSATVILRRVKSCKDFRPVAYMNKNELISIKALVTFMMGPGLELRLCIWRRHGGQSSA